ncbi:hypothetical protein [Lactobacillus helveticus]|uniref:hypothetical protein n=1 Tax=Lactobacillus helveticus TaxID=1587 RepID=UPI00062AAF80|nr:hypothetical protein [Lactobacillus helveticus]AKG66662.1 hypothetical protein TU99_04930 [Lactobacillus helveticus]
MRGMVDSIGYILTAIGGLISAIALIYKALNSSKRNSLTSILNEEDKEIKQKSEDAEIYRRRWFEAEKENDKLNDKLKRKSNNDD